MLLKQSEEPCEASIVCFGLSVYIYCSINVSLRISTFVEISAQGVISLLLELADLSLRRRCEILGVGCSFDAVLIIDYLRIE